MSVYSSWLSKDLFQGRASYNGDQVYSTSLALDGKPEELVGHIMLYENQY